MAATGAIRRFMAQNPKEFDPRRYNAVAKDAMRDICKARYEAFGCAGQASKIKPIGLETMSVRYSKGEFAAKVTA